MNQLQRFIHLRNYSRFLWDEGRREMDWPETAERAMEFQFRNPLVPEKVKAKTRHHIMNLDVFPSFRLVWTAGKAAELQNACIYNCSYLPIDCLDSFYETLYLLMCGTGVGFSVEQQYTEELPIVKAQKNATPYRYCIEDSREGWKDALEFGFEAWYSGRDVYFDISKLRPMGAPLKTMGGRSSGGEVLLQLLSYARSKITRAGGRRLTPIECHDILCEIASIVVVGGVRRSALISLSDLSNEELRNAKRDGFHPRRGYANNSAVYYERPSQIEFMREWQQLASSGTGERGIANLYAMRKNAPHRRHSKKIMGTNPCGEMGSRPLEFCNCSTFVIRSDDDFEIIQDKVRTATWLGVIQSTHLHLPYLREGWAKNGEEEHLLGVSPTGLMDNPGLITDEGWRILKGTALSTMRKACKTLGISESKAVTFVKPSGTSSELASCSSGIHARHAKFYRRNIQIEKGDPLFQCLADQNVPHRDLPGLEKTHAIVSFPVKSPDSCVTRHDLTAIDQLERYLAVSENWAEQNVSCTITVGKDEWIKTADWVWDHFDQVKGLSFFPKEQSAYSWQPYEELTGKEFLEAEKAMPKIDFDRLPDYEDTDQTAGAREYACVGGGCDA